MIARHLIVACLWLTAACVPTGISARAADPEKEDETGKKRAALWQALEKALPKENKQIDVYAENPSLDLVSFRSQGKTLMFSLKSGKVEEFLHMKALGRINRITFEDGKGGGAWIFWNNGQRELTIGSER